MSQSTVIAAALLAGFVLFLAARNRLGAYVAVLWGATAAPEPAASSPSGSGSGGSSGGSILPSFPYPIPGLGGIF